MVALFATKQGGDGAQSGFSFDPKAFERSGFSGVTRLDSSDAQSPVFRMDSANESVLYSRQETRNDALFSSEALVEVERRAIEQRLPPLTAMEAFGRKSSNNPWVEQFGKAARICCANDFTKVTIDGGELETPSITIGVSFELCYSDLMRAEMAGLDVATRLMVAGRRAIGQSLNNYAWYGDSASGIMGVANNPMIGLLNAPYRLDDPSVDPLARINFLNQAVNQPAIASSLAMPAIDAVAVAPSLLRSLRAQRVSNFNKDTVWGDFLENTGIKKVVEVPQLECLNGERTMFLYSSQDEQVNWYVPLPMQVLPQYDTGYGYSVKMIANVNSLWLDYPRHAIKVVG
jgi:hypothetical protein